MNYCFKIKILLLLTGLSAFVSCDLLGGKNEYPTIPGYELNKPVTVSLKTELDEISGIVFYPKDTSVFAINDEQGVLYKIYLRDEVMIEEWKFSDDADYEDLVLVDSTFYALHSNGNVTKFKFFTADSLASEEIEIPLKGKNEFEGMFYDSVAKRMLVLCKDCKEDKKEVSAYTFNISENKFSSQPSFALDAKKILGKLQSDEKNFKPSAAAIHPLTGELYILSSVNKALVITSRDGKEVKNIYPLDPGIFKQPEGITFTPLGDLLISNEFAEIGAGNILIFKYKQQHP